MDTSLDNANNPFANSNGADNNTIIGQKSEGLLLNLSDNFKHNGSDLSPSGDFYHNSEKSNGKRLASEFDDDDDLGPETDVDAVDDVLSPSIAAAKALAEGIVNNNPDGSFNPFVEKHEVEKAALEIDLDLQKQQSSEFDGQRSPREETPTPPADAVHDGGLEENIGDSGEESEDEWNYIKGEEANKENISPSQPDCEVVDLLEDQENMSQLNPNAAEFVPVSPTRSIPSPACRLINDPVIAQSPKRPSEIDINLPDPQDFEKEVKSRPSDVATFSNGHDHEGDQKSPTQELMENLLNGKNIDEIPEFLPGTTPTKNAPSEEFHFGPNAAPFTPVKTLDQSEAGLSTKAVFGDDSTTNLDSTLDVSPDSVDFTPLKHKEDDPMSMSFYQDKSSGDADPFDLNKVQVLPENIDDFLSKHDEHNIPHEDTISDLPEHEPGKNLLSDEIILNNDERIQTTDLDKIDDEKELASPVSNDDESSGICELSKSPQPQTDDLMCQLECNLPKEILPDVCVRPESKSPEIRQESPELEIMSPEPQALSPEPQALSPEPQALSPAPQTLSPEPQALPPESQALSPEPHALSPEPQALSPEPQALSPFPTAVSPEPVGPTVVSPEPAPQILSLEQPLSPEPEPVNLDSKPESVMSPEPEILSSPEPAPTQILSPEPSQEDACQFSKSPIPQAASPEIDVCVYLTSKDADETDTPKSEQLVDFESKPIVENLCNLEFDRKELSVESPIEDVTSSVKDVSSPIVSPVPDQIAPDPIQLNFAQEINNAVESTVTVEKSSPIRDDVLPEGCPLSTPRSTADSVATTDVNSFLQRSPLADLESPLSPCDTTMIPSHPLSKCVYPLPTEIETENITPEFAESVVLSPTEPKDDTPSVPSLEETVKEAEIEKIEETVPVAAAAVVAAAAGVAAATAVTTEKKTAKAKTTTAAKKPLPKTTTTTAKPSPTAAKAKAAPLAAKAKPSTTPRTTPTAPKTAAAPKPALSKAAPKPRTPTTTTARTTTATKKPLANGDVKPLPRTTSLTKKPTETAGPIPSKPAATANRVSLTRSAAPRPTPAPSAARTLNKTTPTTTSPKPASSPLANRTLTSRTASKTASSTTTTSKVASSRTATGTATSKTSAAPKPRPATAPTKPKVPATRTVTKASVDTEKQHKDSANKLTASRTATSTRTTATTAARTTAMRKTETKVSGTTTRTTTVTKTTVGSIGKKPQEIIRNGSKTTKTTKIEKPIQNGVSQVVTEQITIVNNAVSDSETQLLKDNSPIDNKLLVDTNAAD